ncbi:hypothetical protein [Neorhizobium sp. JUb45]|nr:hypothetical protein [Neorhizobium sp. JUb45]TCR06376.1 hypothetical protein EDF70_101330 [Neorhizobium sp. JUb45]
MDFWFFYSIVLPAGIVVLAFVAAQLHEWDLDRRQRRKNRQPGE